MHCKYLPLSHTKALENFSKALYGKTGGTYSARVFRPVMIYMKRLLDSDWLRAVQLKCSIGAKSVTPWCK